MLPACLICQELLSRSPVPHLNYERICTTNCGHVFHAGCINQWFRTLRDSAIVQNIIPVFRCPLCRQGTTGPNVFELFLTIIVEKIGEIQLVNQLQMAIAQQERQLREKEEDLQKILQVLNQNGFNPEHFH